MRHEIPHLLLVIEDETLAEITSFRLELLGYVVRYVCSGEDALLATRDDVPDLVITDLVLPGMNGVELINELRNAAETHEVPIMAFTIDSDLNSVQKAHEAGADDYLVTPYDPAVLEQKLEQLLQLGQTA